MSNLAAESLTELAALIKRELPCHCLPPYPLWNGRTDPNCPWHGYGENLAELMVEDGAVRLVADVKAEALREAAATMLMRPDGAPFPLPVQEAFYVRMGSPR